MPRKYKISVVMWLLINNNIITRNFFLLFMLFELACNFLVILYMYNSAHSIPTMSPSILETLNYEDSMTNAIIAIS